MRAETTKYFSDEVQITLRDLNNIPKQQFMGTASTFPASLLLASSLCPVSSLLADPVDFDGSENVTVDVVFANRNYKLTCSPSKHMVQNAFTSCTLSLPR